MESCVECCGLDDKACDVSGCCEVDCSVSDWCEMRWGIVKCVIRWRVGYEMWWRVVWSVMSWMFWYRVGWGVVRDVVRERVVWCVMR